MSIRRYRLSSYVNQTDLDKYIGPGFSILYASGPWVDVNIEEASESKIENLDSWLAARGYSYTTKPVDLHASATITSDTGRAITSSDWDNPTLIGGVVTSPSFFVTSLARVIGQMTCEISTLGGGGIEIRVIEVDTDGIERVMTNPIWSFPDTSGIYYMAQFQTNVEPKPGPCSFRIQGKLLPGCIAATIRFASFSLMEIL